MSRGLQLLGLCVCIALVAGCTRARDPSPGQQVGLTDPGTVQVFTPYRGSEGRSFERVLADFTARTGIAVRFVGSAAFAENLRDRVRNGDPPDVALIPQPALVAELARDRQLVPLDGEIDPLDTMLPGAAEVGVVDGERFGVWYRMALKSLVWYPPAAFAEAGYDIPRTWTDLLRLSGRIARDGGTPWCIGMEAFGATGWVGTDWIEDLVLRLHGPEVYDRWAAGDVPFTDSRIAEAFEEFGRVVRTPGWVRGGERAVLSTPALTAVLPMLEEEPGCLLSRQASFQEQALPPGTVVGPDGDLNAFVLPDVDGGAGGGTGAPLVASGELVASFTDDPEVLALVRHLSRPAAGRVWAADGGFLSPHATFDDDVYGSDFDRRSVRLLRESSVVRFDASDQMPPDVGTGTFWEGMISFVIGTPPDDVLARIQSGYVTDPPA